MGEMLLGVLREEMDFVVHLAPDAGSISADPGQIEQVVMNLVVNARDAMPKGGKLTLETAHIGRDTVRLGRSSGVPSGDYVMLAVSDTGIGMDAETQTRIFEPFFTTKGKESGHWSGFVGAVQHRAILRWTRSRKQRTRTRFHLPYLLPARFCGG